MVGRDLEDRVKPIATEIIDSGNINKKVVEEARTILDNPYETLDLIDRLRTYYELNLQRNDAMTFDDDLPEYFSKIQQEAIAEVKEKSQRDDLTGLVTQGVIKDRSNRRIPSDKYDPTKYTVLMMDIDDFNEFNTKYGHLVGDFIIKNVAKIIQETLRESLVGRYGGEEFYAELEQTDTKGGRIAGERIIKEIQKKAIDYVINDLKRTGVQFDERLREEEITLSMGIAHENSGTRPDDVRERADHALYESKLRGKNQVHVFEPDKEQSGYYKFVRELYNALKKGKMNQNTAITMAENFLEKTIPPSY